MLLKYSLKKAACLFFTSRAMAAEAGKYTDRKFEITPFGVDTELFNPRRRTRHNRDGRFIVGTVKGLSDKYGIRYILEAVAAVKKQGNLPLELRIAGKGPQEQEYRKLAEDLGIGAITTWLGFISQAEAAREWANMDIALIPSELESESFGVSAVEAQACGTAVVISDIPGLMEATCPDETSIVVPRKNAAALAEAILDLMKNPDKRETLGKNGRQYVKKHYEMDACFFKVETIFKQRIK